MNKPLALVVLFICEFVAAKQCDLEVKTSWWDRFTRKLKKWFNILKQLVGQSDEKDCQECDSIRAPGQKEVGSEKDPKTGCRCTVNRKDVAQCVCCFKIFKFNILICNAGGFHFQSKRVFYLLTIDNYVIFRLNVTLEREKEQERNEFAPLEQLINDKVYKCVDMPSPAEFLSICIQPRIEVPTPGNNHLWKVCGTIKITLLQIPVMKFNLKCFEMKETVDRTNERAPRWDMKIQGQKDPVKDLENPVKAEVTDDSYNSVVCLTNGRKRSALENKSPTPSEEKSGRINWRESSSGGNPPYLAVLHQIDPIPADEFEESKEFPYIADAVKRTQTEKWLNESGAKMFELNGKFCGGTLLTKNKVLTICACIRTFYLVHKLHRAPDDDGFYPFDLQSHDIFMEITGETFTGTEHYRLVKDPTKFMTKSTCANRISKNNAGGFQSLMMVMAFEPEITNPSPGQFVRWRPSLVRPNQEVDMIAFGMERRNWTWVFRNSAGQAINFNKKAVNFFLRQCPLTDYGTSEITKDKMSAEIFSRVSGFCARQLHSQLCYGKIGFPLVSGEELVGLSSLPVDCDADEGSIAGAIFDPVTVSEIDEFLKSDPNCSLTMSLHTVALLTAIFLELVKIK